MTGWRRERHPPTSLASSGVLVVICTHSLPDSCRHVLAEACNYPVPLILRLHSSIGVPLPGYHTHPLAIRLALLAGFHHQFPPKNAPRTEGEIGDRSLNVDGPRSALFHLMGAHDWPSCHGVCDAHVFGCERASSARSLALLWTCGAAGWLH